MPQVEETLHKIILGDSRDLSLIRDKSVNLVVTSPPYPMIEMWDDLFSSMNNDIQSNLKSGNTMAAFEMMHTELDKVWQECFRTLDDGGIMCIVIGDSARTVGGNFQLYPSHSRIISKMLSMGMSFLPSIIWNKPTNSPNKFLGSGTLPVSAYVKMEHENILIFRKGGRREFTKAEKPLRYESSIFWEERNEWFSEIWKGIVGKRQELVNDGSRKRSAGFPIEIPLRLIAMFSIIGDTVLDPFAGEGTTSTAAMLLRRNSLAVEIDENYLNRCRNNVNSAQNDLNRLIDERILRHSSFIMEKKNRNLEYFNRPLGTPVVTSNEQWITMNKIQDIHQTKSSSIFNAEFRISYCDS